MTLAEILIRVGVDASAVGGGLATAEKKLESFGNRLFFMGSRITAGVSAPAGAAAAVVANLGMTFDQSMGEALAIMDRVTPQIRTQMENVAKSITETTKFSADEGAKAYYDLASAGLDASESMEALPIVAKFAQAGLMNLATAGEYLAGAQAAMGSAMDSSSKKIEDMARIGNVLTKANNIALGTVEDFSQALTNKAGQQLRIFNKDVTEGVAVLTAYAKQNIRGAGAGQQLYMALRDLARFAAKNSEAFRENKIAVFDAAGNMRNMADIIADFEKRLEGASNKQAAFLFQQLGMTDRSRAATQALIGYSAAIRENEKKLRDAGGAMDEVAKKQMEPLKTQLKSIGHQFEVLAIDIYKEFEPVIVNRLIPALKATLQYGREFLDWLKALSPAQKEAAVATTAFVVAVGPILTFVGTWILFAKALAMPLAPLIKIIGAAAQTAGAQMGAATVPATSLASIWTTLGSIARAIVTPLGGVVGAILGIVGVLYTASRDTYNFLGAITALIPGVAGFRIIWEGLTAVFEVGWATTKKVSALFYELGRAVIPMLVSAASSLWGAFKSVVQWMGDSMNTQFEESMKLWKEWGPAIISAVPYLEQTIYWWNALGNTIERATKWLKEYNDKNDLDQKEPGSIHTPGVKRNMADIGLDGMSPMQEAMFGGASGGPRKYAGPWLANAKRSDSGMLNTIPDIRPEPTKTLAGTFEDLGGAAAKPVTMLKKLQDELKSFNALAKLDSRAPLSLLLEEYGDQFDTVVRKAKIWGISIPADFQAMYTRIQQYDMAKWSADQAENLRLNAGNMGKFLGDIGKNAGDGAEEWMKSWATNERKTKDLYDRIVDYSARGTDLIIIQSNRARDAEIKGIMESSAISEAQRTAQIGLINTYYDHQVDKALKTFDTLEERMFDQGTFTKKELKKQAKDAELTYKQMIEYNKKYGDSVGFTAQQIYEKWKEAHDKMKQSLGKENPFTKFFSEAQTGMSKLADAWRNVAQTAGEGGFGKFAEGVAKFASDANVAVTAAGQISKAFDGISDAMNARSEGVKGWGAALAGNFVDLAAGIVSGVGAIASATGSGSQGQRMLGGALSGASMGASTAAGIAAITGATAKGAAVAGVWGAAAGAVVGIFVAVLRGRSTRQLMKKVGNEWGVDISEGLAKTIESDQKKFRIGGVEATLLNMKGIIAEAGGANATNLDVFTKKLRDVFSALETGAFDSKQATKVLQENYTTIASAVLETGKVASESFTDIAHLTKRFGLDISAITDFIVSQTSRFGGAMQAVVASTTSEFDAHQIKIDEARSKLEELDEEGANTAEVEEARIRLNALIAQQANAADRARGSMERLSLIVLQGFNASLASGAGIIQALDGIGPALDELLAAYAKLGIEADNAGIKQLMALRALQTEQPALVAGVGALGEAMLALSNIGGLNAETFALMQSQGMSMYEELSAKAQTLGIDQSVAIQMMVPFLKAVLSANEEYGFTIDDNTQKLIDQAREQGYLADEQLDTNSILMQGLGAIIEALGGDVPDAFKKAAQAGKDAFADIGSQAQTELDRVRDEFSNFEVPPVRIPYRWDQEGGDPSLNGGYEVPEMAAGGIVRSATHVVAGEAGPEVIAPLDNLMSAIHSSNKSRSGVADVYLDGRKVGKGVMRRWPGNVRKYVG